MKELGIFTCQENYVLFLDPPADTLIIGEMLLLHQTLATLIPLLSAVLGMSQELASSIRECPGLLML